MTAGFATELCVEEISDILNSGRGNWQLTQPLVYKSDITGGTYTVPTGFVTDFASVPRVPIVFLLCGDTASRCAALHDWLYTNKTYFYGVSGRAALHDWLYTSQTVSRLTADQIFREAASLENIPKWRVRMLYLGVRLFGGRYYA